MSERTWIVQALRNLGYGGVTTAAGGGDELCTLGETRASCPADCFPDVPITEGR